MLVGNSILNPIDCGAVAMVGGFVVVILVSLITPKMNSDRVSQIFKCYDA
jgi:SSS family solute:Na+ symporter